MTTTVKKGAGRPAAAEKSNRHAQRTPLPPKAGSPGAEAIAERAEEIAIEKPMGERTVAELRKMAAALLVPGARLMRKGDLLNAILEAEKAQARVKGRKTPAEAAAQVFEVAEKSAPAKAPEIGRVCDKPQAPDASSADVGQSKSQSKAEAFLEAAAALGWTEKARSSPEQNPYGVIVGRGEERITISWRAGVFVGEECYHSHPGRSPRKIINASAAKKTMGVPPAVADEEARKVTAHKAARPRKDRAAETTTERRKALPFDPETATDEEVLQAVSGRNISWINEISGSANDAYVIGAPTIQPGKSGRSIRFTSATGFTSVRVTSLLSVR